MMQPNATIATEANKAERSLIFLSHANPEDNEIASWLGSRLVSAGYDVWTDVFRFVGGEPFWSDIGEAIRKHAAVLVVILSRTAVHKPGVLNEIALADSTARKLGSPKFIIPTRFDDLPFDEFPEQIIRLNAIDFSKNWAVGLQGLLEALDQRGVPKGKLDSGRLFDEFRHFRERQSSTVAVSPEIVESNWLRIVSLPPEATFCRFGADSRAVASRLGRFKTPIVAWERLGFGFARESEIVETELPDITVEHAYTVDLESFLAGEGNGPNIRRSDAMRMVSNVIRQAWEQFAAANGLKAYQFSNHVGWFVPKSLIENDTVKFVDRSGKQRRKRLVGRSEKRGVFWHFAVTARPVIGSLSRFELRPQVVFTTDGKTPLESKPKMARLRRSFCKNWWNDQWRSLLNAFVKFLSEGESEIRMPLGGAAHVILGAELMAFEGRNSIVGDGPSPLNDEETESETAADDLDLGEEVGVFEEINENLDA